jgi:signal peptidase II
MFRNILETKYGLLSLVAGVVILADQVTKAMVMAHLPLYASVEIISGWFSIVHVQNPGGAFGFMAHQSAGMRIFLFVCISTLAIGLIAYFYHQTPRPKYWLRTGLALIFGGAVGNIVDRLRLGRVVDFLDFQVGPHHWPSFNVADSAITVGMVIFLIHLVFNRMPQTMDR